MCLEAIHEKFDKPATFIQSGWKTFNGTQAEPCFEFFAFKGSSNVPLDQWITAEEAVGKISMPSSSWRNKDYKPGFHVFEDEIELKGKGKHAKRRVYYRRAHTRGYQDSLTIVVALEMYVPSDPDGWPPQ